MHLRVPNELLSPSDQEAVALIDRPFFQLTGTTIDGKPKYRAYLYYPALPDLRNVMRDKASIDYFVSSDGLTYYLLFSTKQGGLGGTVTRDADMNTIRGLDYGDSASGDWVVLKLRYQLLQDEPSATYLSTYLRQGVFTYLSSTDLITNPVFGSPLLPSLYEHIPAFCLTKQNIAATIVVLEQMK
jgi:hypothetical protein